MGQEPVRASAKAIDAICKGNRGLRDDDSNTVVATVSPAVISAPRPVTGRRREAGILAPGRSFVLLPKAHSLSGLVDVRSPVTVAGAAAVLHRVPI